MDKVEDGHSTLLKSIGHIVGVGIILNDFDFIIGFKLHPNSKAMT